jgi:hypothetical protein
VTAENSTATPKRGSQPGVARGSYKPRRILSAKLLSPDELDARAREYWGDLYEKNVKVFARELGRLVSVRTYIPESEPDHLSQDDQDLKVCTGCGHELEMSCFSPSKGGRGGIKALCKSCCATRARVRNQTPQGKVARAMARAKFYAQLKAQERIIQQQVDFKAALRSTKAGRAFLDSRKPASSGAATGQAVLINVKVFPDSIEFGYSVAAVSTEDNT